MTVSLNTFRVGTAEAGRGEINWGEIPIPGHGPEDILPPTVVVVRGTSDGPVVYVGAGTHGDELNSIEAVRRLAVSIDPSQVRGAVILVPLQNRAAFASGVRCTPSDGKNLDHCYPGDPQGSATSALAHAIFTEAAVKADYVLDLHAASMGGWNLLYSVVHAEHPETLSRSQELARLFGARVIVTLERQPGEPLGGSMGSELDNNLFVQASARNIPAAIVEFGGAGRLEPDQVELGLAGINNALAGVGVLDGPVIRNESVIVHTAVAARCTAGGLLYLTVRSGDRVRRGDLLGRVISFPNDVEEVRSQVDGTIVRMTTNGVVRPNDRVVTIAVHDW